MLNFINRSKAARARVKENGFLATLRGNEGVIDLASILVGVVVIGIVGAGVLATVTTIIPFAQDEAAKSDLSAVNTAQSVQFTMAAADGLGIYKNYDELTAPDADGDTYVQDSESIDALALNGGTDFVAVSVSGTGNIYALTNDNPDVQEFADVTEFDAAALGATLVVTDGAPALTVE